MNAGQFVYIAKHFSLHVVLCFVCFISFPIEPSGVDQSGQRFGPDAVAWVFQLESSEQTRGVVYFRALEGPVRFYSLGLLLAIPVSTGRRLRHYVLSKLDESKAWMLTAFFECTTLTVVDTHLFGYFIRPSSDWVTVYTCGFWLFAMNIYLVVLGTLLYEPKLPSRQTLYVQWLSCPLMVAMLSWIIFGWTSLPRIHFNNDAWDTYLLNRAEPPYVVSLMNAIILFAIVFAFQSTLLWKPVPKIALLLTGGLIAAILHVVIVYDANALYSCICNLCLIAGIFEMLGRAIAICNYNSRLQYSLRLLGTVLLVATYFILPRSIDGQLPYCILVSIIAAYLTFARCQFADRPPDSVTEFSRS